MTLRTPKIPNSEHPITIAPVRQRVEVRAGGTVIARSQAALALRESTYRTIYYIPVSDVDQALLRPGDTHSYCPYKGKASYASVDLGERVIEDAVWFYPEPYEAVAGIKNHVAFNPDRVQITVS